MPVVHRLFCVSSVDSLFGHIAHVSSGSQPPPDALDPAPVSDCELATTPHFPIGGSVGPRVQLLAPSFLPAFEGIFPHRHASTPVTIRAPSPVHDGLYPNDTLVFIVGAASHGRAAISDSSYSSHGLWVQRIVDYLLSAFVSVFFNFHTGSHVYDAEYAGHLSCLSQSTAFFSIEWISSFRPVLLVQPLPGFPSESSAYQ